MSAPSKYLKINKPPPQGFIRGFTVQYIVNYMCEYSLIIDDLFLCLGSGVTVNVLHPGVVGTEITRNFRILQMWIIRPLLWFVSYFFFKTLNSGAQTSIYCAAAEELKDVSGKYFKDCAMVEYSDLAKDEKIAEELWKESKKLTGLDNQ